ncbi:MAG TPA: hypothetical protein VFU31_15930 [Candidatus Binatia bacterium]|nr:hypothetical protein [Candidatus Binatia bacterium]
MFILQHEMPDSGDSLFQAGSLRVSQDYEDYLRPRFFEAPEKELMAAVLNDAIACLAKHRFARSRSGRHVYDETREWFLDTDSDWPFSFENICQVLNLNPVYVRRCLSSLIDPPAGPVKPEANPSPALRIYDRVGRRSINRLPYARQRIQCSV